ncbi:hypothetical protein COCMIDRAFT_109863, partial [Bipolaris oryzae ATCC 44560]
MYTPADQTTKYTGNQADGNSTNHYGHNITNNYYQGGPNADECLRDLRVTDPREDRARIEGDKDRLLRDCYAWILDDDSFQRWRTHDEARLLWIKGDPGKGKTMMTMGVIDELSRPKLSHEALLEAPVLSDNSTPLLSFFFCQNTVPALNNAVSVLRGLIYMLVKQRDGLLRYVYEEYKTAGKQLFIGHNAIYSLRSILLSILNDASLPPTYLLIDALDECKSGLPELLRIFTDTSLRQQSRVKWLVTSRNTLEIEQRLQPDVAGIKVSLEVSADYVSKAVAVFVQYKVHQLATVRAYNPRLQAEVQQQLRDKAEGTFLWVSLVCKELEGVPLYRTREVLQALPPGLDPLYERMMGQIAGQDTKTAEYCRDILRSITLAFRPLQLRELAVAAGLPRDQFGNVQAVADLASRCGSFLTVRDGIVSFIHLSAKDFFTTGSRQQVFSGPLEEEQKRMTYRLLDAMDSTLRRDMCSLQKPGMRIQEATGHIQGSCVPQIAYACEYWVEHLQAGEHACSDILADGGKVHSFFQKHLLHWLEAMSLLQKMLEAILALQKLEATLDVTESTTVSNVVHDALRFAMWSGSGIQEAPLQVYYSALVFAPKRSIVRRYFQQEMPKEVQVKCGLEEDWGPLLKTLEGHTSGVTSVAFSAAGDRLASASHDGTVRVWDAKTGQPLHTLKGHTRGVNRVAFSAAGDRLASASDDKTTVKLWDVGTGTLTQTLADHSDSVWAVAFSPDGKWLASASRDKTVKLWEADTGAVVYTLTGHSGIVSAVAFSPDGKVLVSASHDGTVNLWDVGTGALRQTLEGHSDSVWAVAFSPDGKRLASASRDKTVKLWGVDTGAVVYTLTGHSDIVSAVAFSPNGKVLVSGSHDRTIKMWEVSTGVLLGTLDGHESFVRAVAFSPDGEVLASISYDKVPTTQVPHGKMSYNEVVKLWDSSTRGLLQTLKGHSDKPSATAFSPDGEWMEYQGSKELWLPPEYRATCVATGNNILALGHASGRVTFIKSS